MTALPNALWDRQMLDQCRGTAPPRAQLVSVVIGVDPAVEGGDETGIIVVAKAEDGMIWILEDQSLQARPRAWVERVVAVWKRWKANAIVVEVNQGGDVIRELLRSQNINLPIRKVRAKHGKTLRAEPVAIMYANGQVRHHGVFAELEDQLCSCVPGQRATPSPDRLDALVWGGDGIAKRGACRDADYIVLINFKGEQNGTQSCG